VEDALTVAAVDIGTNSTRLLIAEVTSGETAYRLRTIYRLMSITRLGQGVDELGILDREAISRTVEVLRDYRDLMRRAEAEVWEVAATSAARDAANAGEFMDLVRGIMGMEPRIISGGEEASLSFLGATYDLDDLRPRKRPILVVDIGGGSTEIILGTSEETISTYSLDVGCVRMSERFLTSDPPLPQELADMEEYIRSIITPLVEIISNRSPGLLVATAGTATTLSGLRQGLRRYNGEAIHHSWLNRRDVEELYEKLKSLPLEHRRSVMSLEPGRADVIVGGAGVLLVLLRELGWERFLVSEKDILDGLALSAASRAK
jgi:exopolyphosphatase / guanosine-5'-triphosphate,3'-diphosphate pyrophosphatase